MSFLSPATRAALERLLALDDGTDAASDPLARVAAIRGVLAELDADPAALAAVRAALDPDANGPGASWSEVAQAAQLSPAASRWRWQGDDVEIAARHAAGRKRSERPSNKPADLPGFSVAQAATQLGVTAQAIYLRVSRGQLRSETVTLPDGRSYKRVFLEDAAPEDVAL